MSAFVCTKNITFSSIVNLAAKYQEIKNKDLLCQRLYLLNVESVNQRYQLRDSVREENRKEYQSYISNMAGIRYEEHPELHDCQRIKAARCWQYQSCEGDCEEDALFKTVAKIITIAELDVASEIKGEKVVDDSEVHRIIEAYAKNNNIDLHEMWD